MLSRRKPSESQVWVCILQALETRQQAQCDHVLQLRSVQRQSEMHVAEFVLGTSDECVHGHIIASDLLHV